MPEQPYYRLGSLRSTIANCVPEAKLRDKTPIIEHIPTGEAEILQTKGPRTARKKTLPQGIIFVDESYLTIYEKWSIGGEELLGYKYHYQRGEEHMRYDLNETQRYKIPLHHMNISSLGDDVHVPCGGAPVEFGEVLEMIVQHFVP